MALNDVNMEDSSSEDNKSDRPRSSFSDKQLLVFICCFASYSYKLLFYLFLFYSNTKNSKFMERSCSERDLSMLNHSGKKRIPGMNEARSEAQLFNTTIPDVNNTPSKLIN